MDDMIVVKIDNEGNFKSIKYSEISLRNIKFMEQKTLIHLFYNVLSNGLNVDKIVLTNDKDLELEFNKNLKLKFEDSYEMRFDYELFVEKNNLIKFRIRYRNDEIEFKDIRIKGYKYGIIELQIRDFTMEIYAENLDDKFVKAMIIEKLKDNK